MRRLFLLLISLSALLLSGCIVHGRVSPHHGRYGVRYYYEPGYYNHGYYYNDYRFNNGRQWRGNRRFRRWRGCN